MNEITTTPNLWFDPTNCFIGGHWLPTDARETLPLENPSDGTIICEIGRGKAADEGEERDGPAAERVQPDDDGECRSERSTG